MSKFKSKFVLFVLALFMAISSADGAVSAAELVLFETEGCEWCEQWHEDIGVIYAKTAEGKFAPLRRVEITHEPPADLKHLRAAAFTPTFVVIDQGREVGRIIGHPGDNFFWPLLTQILKKAGFKEEQKEFQKNALK
jgi:thioredoxin-related protein